MTKSRDFLHETIIVRDRSLRAVNFKKKKKISYPLIQTRLCAYQEVRTVSFSENFTYVLNEWALERFNQRNFLHESDKESIKAKTY